MREIILENLRVDDVKTKLTEDVVKKGFKEAFDLILELEKHPKKLEKLPKKGILVDTKKGKMIVSLEKEKSKILLL